jgi:hypothetical protein
MPDGSVSPPAVAIRLPQHILPGSAPAAPGPAGPRLLWLSTLLHEAGHALHYLLSSQPADLHASAVYCPLELSELPSHLFERFLDDPRCLQFMFGTPEPLQRVQSSIGVGSSSSSSSSSLAAGGGVAAPPRAWAKLAAYFRRQRQPVGMQQHVVVALLDQLMAAGMLGPGDDLAAALQQLLRRHMPGLGLGMGSKGALEEAAEEEEHEDSSSSSSSSMGFMTLDLARYLPGLALHGGQMYGYIFAQLAAAAVWERHLAADPLDPNAGRELRSRLLALGSSRRSSEIVQGLLGPGSVREVAAGCFLLDLQDAAFQDLQLFG